MTRLVCAMWPRSCATQVARSCRSVTAPNSGCSPSMASSRSDRFQLRKVATFSRLSCSNSSSRTQRLLPWLSLAWANQSYRLEAPIRALREDDAGPRNPVGAFAVNQVPDVVVGAERVRPLVGRGPGVRQAIEQRAERRRSPRENRDTLFELEIHSRILPHATREAPC